MADPSPSPSESVVLVTGGTGLVGKAIEAYVSRHALPGERWVFLSSRDGDLRSFEATKAVFERHRPTAVIHLAAFVGGLFRNLKYKVEFYRHNVLMNDNVMECCRLFEVCSKARVHCVPVSALARRPHADLVLPLDLIPGIATECLVCR